MTSTTGRRVKGRHDSEAIVDVEPNPDTEESSPPDAELEPQTTEDIGGAGDHPQTKKRSRWAAWSGLAVAMAVLVLISGSVAWWMSSHDDELEAANTRDVVLVDATRNIETLNTLDYRKVEEGLKAWRSVTTGTLGDQLGSISPEARKLLADQKKISTGKVVDIAVLRLEGRAATVIAAVEITVRDDADKNAKPIVKRNRFSADLTRVKGKWKLENLQQVAVNVS